MANFPYSSIVKSDFWKNHAKEWLHREILLSPGDFYLNSGVENVSFMNVRKIGGENFSQHTVLCYSNSYSIILIMVSIRKGIDSVLGTCDTCNFCVFCIYWKLYQYFNDVVCLSSILHYVKLHSKKSGWIKDWNWIFVTFALFSKPFSLVKLGGVE